MNRHQEPVIDVMHKSLRPVNDESPYKRDCPSCKDGVLLVGRDLKTGELQEFDHCMSCGQRVRYLDIAEMREVLG